MSENQTILVIDDSTTIRRLVDSTLSREGYRVLVADNADFGIELALEHVPDMIILDHQLPGVTGLDVCKRLVKDASVSTIPVVISSTLRKKAFSEYGDMDNVVDMLSKPYTEELLLTTVSNAIETGVLVVESQAHGTAVPEVIDAQNDSSFCGEFEHFTVREVLDFLNNGQKQGVLEIEADQQRFSVFLNEGRVVGVTATGVPTEEVIDRLPETLAELSTVVGVTMGRGGAALDSIVDLLNTEVLDPRLLRRLLRHQAAVLLTLCFRQSLRTFRFQANADLPPLMQRLPLDISVLALLVEGACCCTKSEVPKVSSAALFSRRPLRGQNLDRAGLTAKQSLVLRQMTTPQTLQQLAAAVGDRQELVRQILFGFELVDLIDCKDEEKSQALDVLVYEPNLNIANSINVGFQENERYNMTVVNDPLAAALLARRVVPSIVVADATDESVFQGIRQTVGEETTGWIAVGVDENGNQPIGCPFGIPREYDVQTLCAALDQVSQCTQPAVPSTLMEPQACAI